MQKARLLLPFGKKIRLIFFGPGAIFKTHRFGPCPDLHQSTKIGSFCTIMNSRKVAKHVARFLCVHCIFYLMKSDLISLPIGRKICACLEFLGLQPIEEIPGMRQWHTGDNCPKRKAQN